MGSATQVEFWSGCSLCQEVARRLYSNHQCSTSNKTRERNLWRTLKLNQRSTNCGQNTGGLISASLSAAQLHKLKFAERVAPLLSCIGEDEDIKFTHHSIGNYLANQQSGEWTYEIDNGNQSHAALLAGFSRKYSSECNKPTVHNNRRRQQQSTERIDHGCQGPKGQSGWSELKHGPHAGSPRGVLVRASIDSVQEISLLSRIEVAVLCQSSASQASGSSSLENSSGIGGHDS